MEPSSSFVDYHEFLDVLLQPVQSNQQIQDHVEEAARRKTGEEDPVVAKSKPMMRLVSSVFLLPSQQISFRSDQEAVRHVKESSEKQPERGIGSGKTKAYEYEKIPTMRHVSRTHRVALDWLCDNINLDPKIQLKDVDTKKTTRRHANQRKLHTS